MNQYWNTRCYNDATTGKHRIPCISTCSKWVSAKSPFWLKSMSSGMTLTGRRDPWIMMDQRCWELEAVTLTGRMTWILEWKLQWKKQKLKGKGGNKNNTERREEGHLLSILSTSTISMDTERAHDDDELVEQLDTDLVLDWELKINWYQKLCCITQERRERPR